MFEFFLIFCLFLELTPGVSSLKKTFSLILWMINVSVFHYLYFGTFLFVLLVVLSSMSGLMVMYLFILYYSDYSVNITFTFNRKLMTFFILFIFWFLLSGEMISGVPEVPLDLVQYLYFVKSISYVFIFMLVTFCVLVILLVMSMLMKIYGSVKMF